MRNELELEKLLYLLKKNMLFMSVFLFILMSLTYIYQINKQTMYQGDVLLEVGYSIIVDTKINSSSKKAESIISRQYFDPINTIKTIVEKETGVTATVPFNVVNLIQLSYKNHDKSLVKIKLKESASYILQRHTDIMNDYISSSTFITNTKIVKTSDITKEEKNIKKVMIIIFIFGIISSFILSILIELFIGIKSR